jgi:MATE family multidrug resistance protein
MKLTDYTREFGKNTKLAYPIVLGQVAHMLVALADNIMVGNLGKAQLAAVSLGNTLVFIAMSVGIGFSFAITPLVAQADGESRPDKVKSALSNGLLLCTLIGVILCVLLIVAEPVLYMMDQPSKVVDLAIPYMRWVSFSIIPLMIFQAFKQFSDGLSRTEIPMYTAIIANVINVFVNYLFIYGKFGFPELQVEGAAIGTFVARVIMAILLLVLLLRKQELKKYFDKLFTWSVDVIRKLLNLGLPTSLQMFFEVSLFTAAILLSGILGTQYQAANQIALNLSSLTFMFGVGLGLTATIRVANQSGLGNFDELKRIARSLFLMTLFMEIIFALCFVIFHQYLPLIYIDDIEVIDLAANALLIAALFQISDGLQVVILGALRGMQDVWIPSLICFVSYWIFGLPVSYYLGTMTYLKLNGVWIGLLIALTLSSVLMYARFRYLLKKNRTISMNTSERLT